MPTAGQLVWLGVEDTPAWVRAKVEESGATVKVRRMDNSESVELTADAFEKLSLAEGDHVPPAEDLTQLDDSSDATFLDSLRRRYDQDLIYTAIGPVIISVNPYKPVSGCTSEAIASLCQLGTSAPPHVARVATIAFNGMTAHGGESRAQSILISGESGAGKTEACKLCLLALAELSKSSGQATEAALESAELLEAFGNAKTVYNENSSRFGKWCAVFFDRSPHIASCQTEVYLLEKTRIIGPPPGERNYHIFYQLLAGASAEERVLFKLGKSTADYDYVKSGVLTLDGVDDAKNYAATRKQLDVLGLGGARQAGMMRLFSAVLAIGNLTFRPRADSKEGFHAVADAAALTSVAALLEVDGRMLETKLTSRVIQTGKGSSSYTVPLSHGECMDTRDALAKSAYHELFQWLVGQLNEAQRGAGPLDTSDEERFVGLLDIFGFENFKKNSFEQLCINFTNERLQAHFMDALVKLKLSDYKAEGIDCTAIDFPDNVAQLQLIDHKSLGIFALLDDECSVPKGTEQQFVDKLQQAFFAGRSASACYDKGKRAKGGVLVGEKHGVTFPSHGAQLDAMSFVVVHYAEQVQYTADGWLDKNRGYLHPDVAFVLTQSNSSLVSELYPASCVDVTKKSTVSSTFRRSLRDLSTTMLQTAQNYLRCIKPNGVKKPDAFDGHFVLRQLRYTGVASVVQIQRSGYPIAMSQADFIARYRCIAFAQPQLLAASLPPATICTNLLRAGPALAGAEAVDWLHAKDAQVGKTRVYLRDHVGKVLEKPRLEATRKAATSMQRFLRGIATRRITSLMLMHARGAAAVRSQIAACAVREAGVALDALAAQWKDSRLERALAISPLLPPMHAELEELENEIISLEAGLEAEAEALEELRAALAAASASGVSPKEAYVQLKVALASALDVSRGLRAELTEAIALAEAALSSCLTGLGLTPEAAAAALANLRHIKDELRLSRVESGPLEDDEATAARMAAEEAARQAAEATAAGDAVAAEAARQAAELAAWEAEVARQAAEKEEERRARQEAYELELVKEAAGADPAWTIVTVMLNNDADGESSVYKQLVGYTAASTGVTFTEKNTISKVRPGSIAAREGHLHVGDVVLAVDGKVLKGERVPHALNTVKKAAYELRVARPTHAGGPGVHGEYEGWLMVVKAKDGNAMPLQWARKYWVVLDGNGRTPQLLFFESSRGGKAARPPQLLKGALCKTPVMMLKGSELKQPPVISSFLQQRRFPFTLSWPDKEIDHDLVLASATSTDRSEWTKALNALFKLLKAQAPTSGWLVKQGGRDKSGLAAMLARDRRRWFVLEQPLEGANATFRYYDSPPPHPTTPSRGMVVLNRSAQLLIDDTSKMKHAFCITSKGANDPRAISTHLAAESQNDLTRWMKALRKAIDGSGGDVAALGDLMTAAGDKMRKLSVAGNDKKGNLMQLAELEEEQLKGLKLKLLLDIAEHLQILATLDPKTLASLKDKGLAEPMRKKKVVDLIISQRQTHAIQDKFDLYEPAPMLQTWTSRDGMHQNAWL